MTTTPLAEQLELAQAVAEAMEKRWLRSVDEIKRLREDNHRMAAALFQISAHKRAAPEIAALAKRGLAE